MNRRMIIAVAVNPRASFGRGRHPGTEAAAYLHADGAEVLLPCEDSYAELAAAVDRALESGVDALVVVGGDGMVHLGINALAGRAVATGPGAAGGSYGTVPLGIGDGRRRTLAAGAMLISVANGQPIGGGMKVTPDAVLDDGYLDLFIVAPPTRLGPAGGLPKGVPGFAHRASGGGPRRRPDPGIG
jgi:diacylglycerol kinase family enzyme